MVSGCYAEADHCVVIITTKGLGISSDLGIDSFKASDGWNHYAKGIACLSELCVMSVGASEMKLPDWNATLPDINKAKLSEIVKESIL